MQDLLFTFDDKIGLFYNRFWDVLLDILIQRKKSGVMKEEIFRIKRQLSELYRDHDVYISPISGFNFNDFVCISHRAGKSKKKSVYVWLRIIDDYYRTFYNSVTESRFHDQALLIDPEQKSIVLCKHYREKLGLKDAASEGVYLEIKKIHSPFKKIRALYNAPDSMIRTTTVISVISVALGILALILGVISLR